MDFVFFVEESTIGCFLPESNQLLESLIMTILTSVALPCVAGGNDGLLMVVGSSSGLGQHQKKRRDPIQTLHDFIFKKAKQCTLNLPIIECFFANCQL